jgi:hypothetical protein
MPTRRFPPPWSVEVVMPPLSHNVSMAAVIFSFSLHPLAKKISAKKLSYAA